MVVYVVCHQGFLVRVAGLFCWGDGIRLLHGGKLRYEALTPSIHHHIRRGVSLPPLGYNSVFVYQIFHESLEGFEESGHEGSIGFLFASLSFFLGIVLIKVTVNARSYSPRLEPSKW